MGVGRRIGKKQGAPTPLSDEHFAKLRRKAGLPAEEPKAPVEKKRKRKGDTKTNGGTAKKAKTSSVTAAKLVKGAKALKLDAPAATKTNGKTKTKVKLPLDDDEDDALDGSDPDSAERLSDLEDGMEGLKDDFLESDSDVYDSDADQQRGMFSEDEDESDAEEKLTAANIEGLTKKLDQQLEEDEAEARAEIGGEAMQTNIDGEAPQILEDEDEDELKKKSKAFLAPDLQVLRNRITENIRVLEDFKNLAQKGRSRSEYTAQLLKDVCAYYGYSEYLAEKLFNLFSPREAFEFFEANETPRPVVIRTNTLRTNRRDLAQALINRGVTLEPVGKWSKVGLQIFESSVPLGATPEYLAGHYILQAASSFLPCMALDPQEGERVLDMSAAPGGKSSMLSAMMKNTGVIIANDASRARTRALVANLHRLGCKNAIVTNYDAREIPRLMKGFDRVLLDAPCTGTGVVSKDPSVKTNRGPQDYVKLPFTQKQLLLAAIEATKTGGTVVYSTCSVCIEENESVVHYVLQKLPNVRLVDTGLTFGREGFVRHSGKVFHDSMRLTRRVFPHSENFDGFFVAKLVKTSPNPLSSKNGANGALDGEVDKTPIVDDEKVEADDFGGFDEEEDAKYMDKAKKNAMRKKGLNPKSAEPKKKKKNAAS